MEEDISKKEAGAVENKPEDKIDIQSRKKEYYQRNKERIKAYYQANREKRLAYQNEYHKKKKEGQPR